MGTTLAKKDTGYYLIDTAKIPSKDRMFHVGVEGHAKFYALICKCYPWNLDPVFTYPKARKGNTINKESFNKIKTIELKDLINIAVRYGIEKIDKTVIYFIEPQGKEFIAHEVFLLDPKKPYLAN